MRTIVVGPDQAELYSTTDTVIIIQACELENFKRALIRAVDTWQDAPPEILLLKRKLCGDPVTVRWPDPKDFPFVPPN